MLIKNNYNLQPLNSFNVPCIAKQFVECNNINDVFNILQAPWFLPNNFTVLGGGSNILLTKNIDGLVIKNNILGINLIKDNSNDVHLKVGAGEGWNNLVNYCVQHNYGGIENLSLIPGSVGAAPIQNIGAYGVELSAVIVEVEGVDVNTKKLTTINHKDCAFGYRDSIFKNTLKNKFIITSITIVLQKNPVVNVSYGDVAKRLQHIPSESITIKDVSAAIVAIRTEKLPNPKEYGNAGSFFKNIVVPTSIFTTLQAAFPLIPHFTSAVGIKIPTAWLIEQCGFKGLQVGQVGCYKNQPLVIVNYGGATGLEVYNFSTEIINAVHQKFKITLEREVNVF